jgi:hypothetical protein
MRIVIRRSKQVWVEQGVPEMGTYVTSDPFDQAGAILERSHGTRRIVSRLLLSIYGAIITPIRQKLCAQVLLFWHKPQSDFTGHSEATDSYPTDIT